MGKQPLKKMILVDDDEDVLTIAKYCLESLKGVDIKYLTSGEETLKEALSFQPDLILLDIMMPKMDGITTLKTMKLVPNLTNIPVVFFTAKVQKEELAQYQQLGAIETIIKPFDPLTLADNILKIWDRYQERKASQ